VSSTNLAIYLCAHSCTVLLIPTSFDHISNSQHSALENPESTCDLRPSARCNWSNSDFGFWSGVILEEIYEISG